MNRILSVGPGTKYNKSRTIVSITNRGPPLPQPESDASHLSTRDLMFDPDGIIYMVIRRQAVSMRSSDYRLNASQILTAARLPKNKRDHWLCSLKRHGVTEIRDRSHWIPFPDGVYLCQAAGLENDLQPLLEYPRLAFPDPKDNYFLQTRIRPVKTTSCERPSDEEPRNGFARLKYGDCVIAYQPSQRTINATHLLQAQHIHRQKLVERV